MDAVYFGEENAYLVSARVNSTEMTVNRAVSAPLTKGILVNGGVRDPEGLKLVLTALKEKWASEVKACGLVLDSSLVFNKKVELPPAKPAELALLVKNEFHYMDVEVQNLLVDYTPLKFTKSERGNIYTLAFAMEKAVLQPYVDGFEAAGFGLKYVDVSLNALVKVIEREKSLNGHTFVFVYVWEETMVACLFDKGGYFYSNRVPLNVNRGTMEFVNALLQEVTSILRFHRIQKNLDPVEQVVCFGLNEQERTFSESLSRLLRLPVTADFLPQGWKVPPDLSFDPALLWYPLGSMLER